MENCENAVISEEYADLIIRSGSNIEAERYCRLGIIPRWDIYYIPLSYIGELTFENIGYVTIPDLYVPSDLNVANETGISSTFLQPALNLTGKGVIIGIIDSGIDYGHRAFTDNNDKTRIISIWDQTVESDKRPSGFFYGTEYTRTEIDEAMLSENPHDIVKTTDESGHGTFLTGIAAGRYDINNNFTGMAPDAEIVFVKLKPAKTIMKEVFAVSQDKVAYEESDIMAGLRYINDVADREKKPVVILLGMGTSQGSHRGNSPLADSLNYYAGRVGRILVTSAGNECNRGRHFLGKIGEEEYEIVELRVGNNESGFTMELWSGQTEYLTISVTSPSGEEISRIPIRRQYSEVYTFVFENTTVYIYNSVIENASGAELILLRFTRPTAGIWTIRVYGRLNDEYNIWLPAGELISNDTYFLNSNPDITVTEAGNAAEIKTVGAYDYRDGGVFVNSGRGYALNGTVKPDIVAPGVNVLGPKSADTLSEGAKADNRNQYIYMTGTSVAAAVTAGGASLITQWEERQANSYFVDTRGIKSLIIRGAKRDSNYVYPNRIQGYGKLDILGVFEYLKGK